jgi:hypothetical protein
MAFIKCKQKERNSQENALFDRRAGHATFLSCGTHIECGDAEGPVLLAPNEEGMKKRGNIPD